jgi:hypothetical protein
MTSPIYNWRSYVMLLTQNRIAISEFICLVAVATDQLLTNFHFAIISTLRWLAECAINRIANTDEPDVPIYRTHVTTLPHAPQRRIMHSTFPFTAARLAY